MKNIETLKEVPMPIQNKNISSWNKSNTTPNFDGEYLCYIRCREELEENPFGRQEKSCSEDEAIEFFIEGYKQRAIASDLIFDNASRMYAIHLFEQFKNK